MKTDLLPDSDVSPAPGVVRCPGGARRWLRRALRPLATVALTGALTLGMVSAGSQQAQAVVFVIPPPVVVGATEALLPSLAAGLAAITPVGWGLLALGALSVVAYSTQDTWLPYVKGLWGDSAANKPPTPLSTQQRHRIDSAVLQSDGMSIVAVYSNSVPYSQDWYMRFGVVAHCIDQATGRTGYRSSNGYWAIDGRGPTSFTYSWTAVPCPSGQKVTGFIAGGGQDVGKYTPNLNTSDPQPAQMDQLQTIYDYATTSIIKWGDMAAPAFDPSDPKTTYNVSVECLTADGVKTTLSAVTTGDQKAVKVPSCAAAGMGHGTGKVDITGTAPTPGATSTPLWSRSAPGADTAHPLCGPTVPGPGCKLQVLLDSKPCVVGQLECVHWGQIRIDTPARLSCQYGPYAVAMTECNMLERAYELGGSPMTEPNIDGDPSTRSSTDPAGNQIPKNNVDTGTGTLPQTGINPGVDGVPGTQGENCLATGWSWNPVSWVMVPVQCAMQWAFVPTRARLDAMTATIQPRLQARGVDMFTTQFVPQFSGLGGSGCSGPAVDLSAVHLKVYYPFSACEAPMSTIAGGVSAFLSLWLIVNGGMSCIRAAAAAFGFNWGLGKGDEPA